MSNLAKDWGNIPRTLMQSIDESDQAVETRYRQEARKAIRISEAMVVEALRYNFHADSRSMFYFLRPMTTTTGDIDRKFSYIYVPTQTLRRILAEALQGLSNVVKLQFYNALSYHPNTLQAASFIFENWFHSFFIVEKRINCQWVRRRSAHPSARFPAQPGMPQGATDLIPATQDAPRTAAPPYYWIPPSDFPGIDSALVLEKQIFVFQVTFRSALKSLIDGLECLRNMLPRELKDVAWKVVFVGPDEANNKYIAEHWHRRLSFPTKKKRALVGWSVVDPAQDGVKYRVCKFDNSRAFSDLTVRSIATSLIRSRLDGG